MRVFHEYKSDVFELERYDCYNENNSNGLRFFFLYSSTWFSIWILRAVNNMVLHFFISISQVQPH